MLQQVEGINQSKKFKLYLLTDDNVWDVTKISDNFQELEDIISGLSQDDEHIDCIEEKKKLNVVLKELRDRDKTLQSSIDTKTEELKSSIDTKAEELKKKDKEIIEVVKSYKEVVDEYNENLGVYVARHDTANTGLEKLL